MIQTVFISTVVGVEKSVIEHSHFDWGRGRETYTDRFQFDWGRDSETCHTDRFPLHLG